MLYDLDLLAKLDEDEQSNFRSYMLINRSIGGQTLDPINYCMDFPQIRSKLFPQFYWEIIDK